MFRDRHRRAHLDPALVAQALALLATDRPEDRLAAAQLLAQAYSRDEDQRLAEQPERERSDGYDERADCAVDWLALLDSPDRDRE